MYCFLPAFSGEKIPKALIQKNLGFSDLTKPGKGKPLSERSQREVNKCREITVPIV